MIIDNHHLKWNNHDYVNECDDAAPGHELSDDIERWLPSANSQKLKTILSNVNVIMNTFIIIDSNIIILIAVILMIIVISAGILTEWRGSVRRHL